MRLDELALRLQTAGLEPVVADATDIEFEIDQLTADSRLVGPNGLFVAVRGVSTDGHLFIDKAVNNGAIAIVHEAMPGDQGSYAGIPPGIASMHVLDTQSALGIIGSALCSDPSESVACIGVTGTNGKTTTSYLLYQLLESLGQRSGLIGTIGYRAGRSEVASTHTTPDAVSLQKLLARMRDAKCEYCSMEVSSHALSQKRVAGIDFRAAVFTNLTRDHLDYHGSMASYRDAKKSLFDGLDPSGLAVSNVDDPAGKDMIADTRASTLTYGQSDAADVQFEVRELGASQLILSIDGSLLRSGLVGLFNAYNLAACYATAVALGLSPPIVKRLLQEAQAAPGRFEQVPVEGGPTVIVDYAHTPDALENVLSTIQSILLPGARTICVFGCGGDRDATKRPMMGAIAERSSDKVIVTNDNPRTEDPHRIFSDIRKGMERPADAHWEPDRAAAIRFAIAIARPTDVVLVAGKGHETYQINGNETIHFDDREVVRAAAGPTG